MLNIVVCCEDTDEMNRLKRYMAELQKKRELSLWVDWYMSFDILLNHMEILLSTHIVIVYGDINAARIIKELEHRLCMILIAPEINRELYSIQPCYMLYEPFGAAAFEKVFMSAVYDIYGRRYFCFTSRGVTYRKECDDILYFENEKRLIHVVCTDERYSYYGNINDLEEELASVGDSFLRTHSSYIVNMEHVKRFSTDYVRMSDDYLVRISRGRRIKVREHFEKYMQNKGTRYIS